MAEIEGKAVEFMYRYLQVGVSGYKSLQNKNFILRNWPKKLVMTSLSKKILLIAFSLFGSISLTGQIDKKTAASPAPTSN